MTKSKIGIAYLSMLSVFFLKSTLVSAAVIYIIGLAIIPHICSDSMNEQKRKVLILTFLAGTSIMYLDHISGGHILGYAIMMGIQMLIIIIRQMR